MLQKQQHKQLTIIIGVNNENDEILFCKMVWPM